MTRYTKQGTPNHHVASALSGHQASKIVPMRKTAREMERERAFKDGFLVGLLVGLVALCLVIWLWAVPAVDGAVDQAQANYAEAAA